MSTLTETAKKIHALFSEGKLTDVTELATGDVEVELVPFGQVLRGRDGFLQFMGAFKTSFPDMRIEWTNSVANGDQVVCECRWTGTHDGPLTTPQGTLAPTGKRVEHGRFVEVFRFRDGKLARLTNYQDPAGWLHEIGVA